MEEDKKKKLKSKEKEGKDELKGPIEVFNVRKKKKKK